MTPPDSGEREVCEETRAEERHKAALKVLDAIEERVRAIGVAITDGRDFVTLPPDLAQRILAALERADFVDPALAAELRARLPK